MHGDDGYFDERVAAGYDESSADMFEPAAVDPVVDLLVKLAGSGRALELGIGTGRIAIGDFAATTVPGSFAVAYLVYNTVMNLTTQAAQVACFQNVADHLDPGGRFVVEVMIPDLQRLPLGDRFRVFDVSDKHWVSTSTTS